MILNKASEKLEKLSGIVERITFHNEQNGWSVLEVSSFKNPGKLTSSHPET